LPFRPDDQYQSLTPTAGGDALVLATLENTKIGDLVKRTKTEGADQSLQHLAMAGKFMRSKQYREAATELVDTLQIDTTPEAGFVMGGLLYQQERRLGASRVYAEVLRQDIDFTEAHTKLGYVLLRLDDPVGGAPQSEVSIGASSGKRGGAQEREGGLC
jgi:hypothetical protein